MTIKCLAFDLDGTLLLDESKRMDPRTVDSIQGRWHKVCTL